MVRFFMRKGTWGENGEERQVAVMFGPQYGSLTTLMVEEGIRAASRDGVLTIWSLPPSALTARPR